jgi:spermidine synthase
VVIDVSVRDPYWHGLFTREFFELAARHMTEDGILFMHDQTEFYSTLQQVFPFGYSHAPGPGLERLIARATDEVVAQRFYSRHALTSERAAAAGVVGLDDPPGGNIYTDERIQWSTLP